MLGDVLKRNLSRLENSSTNKRANNALWKILRDIAIEEIKELGSAVDSDVIIPVYYEILLENITFVPKYYREKMPSNNQERFRVVIRNIFSSNAFHNEGIANNDEIYAYKVTNENKKGKRIVFKKK